MNFSQKLGLFVLIVISVAYVYFSFFSAEGIHMTLPHHDEQPPIEELPQISEEVPSPTDDEPAKEHSYKTVKIYVADSNGNIRSVNRKCDTSVEKSCFAYAIKELIAGPTKWEKSKGFTSEIPLGTKILSVREGDGNIMIDLSSAFEGGGGAEQRGQADLRRHLVLCGGAAGGAGGGAEGYGPGGCAPGQGL